MASIVASYKATSSAPVKLSYTLACIKHVPQQNLYRRLAKLLDWSFLYQQTQAQYSHTSQPFLSPVIVFKLIAFSRSTRCGSPT